jgi:hypothetical protein
MSTEENKTIDVIPAFNHGDINETHQSAAKEIANWLKSLGQTELSDELLFRFKINQIPVFDIEQSKFYQYAKKAGIYVATQGMLKEGEGKNAVQYPLVVISGDIRQMDKFIDVIKNSDE